MKGLLNRIGKAVVQTADNIASYDQQQAEKQKTKLRQELSPGPGQQVLDPVLEYLLRNVRSRHVRKIFLDTPARNYTETKPVRVLATTYNVNAHGPPEDVDIGQLLGLWAGEWPSGVPGMGEPDHLPDIIMMGYQEIVPLTAGNVIIGGVANSIVAWDRAVGSYLNGEKWAAQHYTAVDKSIDAAAKEVVLASLTEGWQGGSSGPAPVFVGTSGGKAGVVGTWAQVAAKQLVGTYISVWVRRALIPHVRGVQVSQLATGFGGWAGNKGAVLCRMQVFDTPLLLINTHLSAGEKEGDAQKRCLDVATIIAAADLPPEGWPSTNMANPAASLLSASLGIGHFGPARAVLDHSNIIWVGDLNWRLASSVISDDAARTHLRAGRLAPLILADELAREMVAGRTFSAHEGWREGPITFPPTFKFKVGSHNYMGEEKAGAASGSLAARTDSAETDVLNGTPVQVQQKRRTPAWCDRVLWRSTNRELHQLSYRRSEMTASDHKPVAAAFMLQARHLIRPKVEVVLQESRRQVDQQAALQRPKCTLNPNVLDLREPLQLFEIRTVTVTLDNTGAVEGLWHFIPPPSHLGLDDEDPALPAWLTTDPVEGMVPAGGQCTITLCICVKSDTAAGLDDLTPKPMQLDTVVILRVEDGGDLFIAISGSCSMILPQVEVTNLDSGAVNPLIPQPDEGARGTGQEARQHSQDLL